MQLFYYYLLISSFHFKTPFFLQPHINEFRQRLDQEITEVKRRLDSDVAQTQCDIDAAQRRQQEAENRLSDLERQVDLASKEATATDAQIDELKTALVVATRSPNQSQSLRSQETINKLKQEVLILLQNF